MLKFFAINLRPERTCCFVRYFSVKALQMTEKQSSRPNTVLVKTPQGELLGAKRQTVYEHSYYSFEGIPYAKPPLGDLRFCSPQPAESWTGVRDCTEIPNKPVQKNIVTGEVEGDEDCLYINLYVKTLNSTAPLPVLVWIYGGSYTMGEGSRRSKGPDYFMKENVILACFNYRLCSLGFLTLDDPECQVPGNAGLKDQVMALKWIKENIAHFNGDANNITLFGESAGSTSTHYMSITEQTRGLFHKAILMSGTVHNPWACLPKYDFAYRLAKYHGYQGENNDREILKYLRKLEPKKLVSHAIIHPEDHYKGCIAPFLPTVEPYVSDDCVIPKKPIDMLANAWSNSIPMLIGGTSFEGLLMYQHLKKNPVGYLKTSIELVLPVEVRKALSYEKNRELGEKVLRAHFGDKEPGVDTLSNHADIYSFKYFWHGFHRTAMSRLAFASAPTYLYRFDFDSRDLAFHRIKYCGEDADKIAGVAHADDLPYFFFVRESWKLEPETPEYRTILRMIGMWTAFAQNSDPNCDIIKPTIWQPLDKNSPHLALDISNELKMKKLPESEKLLVWDSLYSNGESHGNKL